MIATQVSKYILSHNPPWVWPYRFASGLLYQLYKRSIGKPFHKKLFNGQHITLYPDCPMSSFFVYTAIPDKEEIMFLRQQIKPGVTFIDIGANIGAYGLMLCDLVEKIIAFEPDETTYQRLSKHLSGCGVPARAEKLALSDYEGQGAFSKTCALPSNKLLAPGESGVNVQVTTLDNYATKQQLSLSTPYILKIDVEGEEFKVLRGAKSFLQHYPITGILLECFDEAFEDVQGYLNALGFKLKPISYYNYWAYKDE